MARPSASQLRGHFAGTLPISIAVHLVALLLLFGIPLVANIVIPTVMVTLPDYVRVAPMPPPPQVLIASAPRPSVAPRDSAAPPPTVAPPSLEPEAGPPAVGPGPVLPDIPGGVPSGMGLVPSDSAVTLPPPDPPRQGPVRVADLPVAPRKTVDVRPIYPELARMARVEGTVVVEAVLDPSGRVTQLRVIKSIPLLDGAAMDAMRQWRYTPSLYGGRPVSVLMTITMRFTLQ
jgi:protein TonB